VPLPSYLCANLRIGTLLLAVFCRNDSGSEGAAWILIRFASAR
jgi:hypothetical protein